ncbi:MAG TPA: amidohydrolase [Planctomycetaceae bacterium]|nr:amidohydrolase [Planctomycetaceae bacterium]
MLALMQTAASGQEQYYSLDDFSRVAKIDIHAHIHTDDTDFVNLSKRDRFRFVNMAVWSSDSKTNAEKHRTMWVQYEADPDRTAPICSFPLENWDSPDWQQATIAYLKEQFDRGAVGVKIWKNIGMELRDSEGQLVMVDDPKLDPVIDYIESRGKVLLGHLGEPKNCWLPIDELTTLNDRSYFSENPKYHMHLHPEMPSYEEQVAARDRMLDKHPTVSFVGCHLASLEWSVDRIAAFLERYPNATVGVAARMGQLQYQTQRDRQRVRKFFIEYQDRIMYGTDTGVRPGRGAEKYAYVKKKWLRDWEYFNTDHQIEVPELPDPVQGIKLPKTVVDKIYRDNALRVFAASWPGQKRSVSLPQLNWLAGKWRCKMPDKSVVDEDWMRPSGTAMLGMNRTVRGDGQTSFEFMRIASEDGSILFFASPSGRKATPFNLAYYDQPNQRVAFENEDNDFPNRVIYDRRGDELTGRIEGKFNGQPASLQWKFELVE